MRGFPDGPPYSSESETMRIECPKCGSTDKRLSRSAGLFDPFRRALGYVAYRCRSCRARYFKRPRPDAVRPAVRPG